MFHFKDQKIQLDKNSPKQRPTIQRKFDVGLVKITFVFRYVDVKGT